MATYGIDIITGLPYLISSDSGTPAGDVPTATPSALDYGVDILTKQPYINAVAGNVNEILNFIGTGGTTVTRLNNDVTIYSSSTGGTGGGVTDYNDLTNKPNLALYSLLTHNHTGIYQPIGSYLTAETEPAFTASQAFSITAANKTNWNTAYSWGNHSGLYSLLAHNHSGIYQPVGSYLTGTKVDSFNTRTGAVTLSLADITTLANGTYQPIGTYLTGTKVDSFNTRTGVITLAKTDVEAVLTGDISTHTHSAYSLTTHNHSGIYQPIGSYLTTETEPLFTASAAYGITAGDITTWNAATGGGITDDLALHLDTVNHRVGIGTTTPNYKLDVEGTGAFDGVSSFIGFNIEPVADPIAPTAVVSAGGSVDTGTHYYYVSYVTAIGETHTTRTAAAITTTSGNNTVTLTIPVSSDNRVTGRKIYKTKAGAGASVDYLLTTINDNTTTTYVDTALDSTLTGSASVGYFRLNTTSKNITVNGIKALTVDAKATYIGYNAGNAITTGGRNVFIGQTAGQGATTANDLVIIGNGAGTKNITGSGNIIIGSFAGGELTSGSNNTIVAYNGIAALTTGSNNTAVGSLALISVLTSSNVGIGYQAGRYLADGTTSNTSPTSSIYIGANTRANAATLSNEIVIGDSVTGGGSNTVSIGNSSIVRNFFEGVLNIPLKTIATATAAGTVGDITYDANYIYVATGANTWKRAALTTW